MAKQRGKDRHRQEQGEDVQRHPGRSSERSGQRSFEEGGRGARSSGKLRSRPQRLDTDDIDLDVELSERGGIAPTERSPGEQHDRTRDRSIDRSRM